jgi:uncharacterized membrane protein
MGRNRLEAFSDGVIAIIITIMVLNLKTPTDPTLRSLFQMWPALSVYALSFLTVAIYWVNHHHLLHLAHHVDGPLLWANMNLLFWMSLLPWVTGYLGENHALPLPIGLYGGVALACAHSFHWLAEAVVRHRSDDSTIQQKMRKKGWIAQGIYLTALVAAPIWSPLALILIAVPPLMYFMPDRRIEGILGSGTAAH